MKRNETAKKYIKFTGVGKHLDSIYNRMWAHFVETPEESYYLLAGEKITPTEMDVRYPIVEMVENKVNKGRNLDGRIIN